MLKENLDRLIELATGNHFSEGIYEARKEYQQIAGDIYEDDKTYESRMAMFLEWYVYDRVMPDGTRTPLEMIIEENAGIWPQKLREIFEGFSRNVHGMFLIKKIRDRSVIALNLFDNEKYDVIEEQGKMMFNKKDLFEGRLVPFENGYHFTGNFCFHPHEAFKFIRQEVAKISFVQVNYKNTLQRMKSERNALIKNLTKINSKIEKLRAKLQKAKTEQKISGLKNDLADLETQRSELEGRISIKEKENADFEKEKITREGRKAQTRLTQKLSYMNLKWERSRQIDLTDIYRN